MASCVAKMLESVSTLSAKIGRVVGWDEKQLFEYAICLGAAGSLITPWCSQKIRRDGSSQSKKASQIA
jgi:hypothetical protein